MQGDNMYQGWACQWMPWLSLLWDTRFAPVNGYKKDACKIITRTICSDNERLWATNSWWLGCAEVWVGWTKRFTQFLHSRKNTNSIKGNDISRNIIAVVEPWYIIPIFRTASLSGNPGIGYSGLTSTSFLTYSTVYFTSLWIDPLFDIPEHMQNIPSRNVPSLKVPSLKVP